VEAFISKIERKYHIYLIIIIAVVIYTSVIVFPYNAVGKTLDQVKIESNSIGQNIPSFDVGESPVTVAVDQNDNIAYVANNPLGTVSVINGTYGAYRNIANVSVGTGPVSIAVDQNDNINICS
jgi:DNA-binding beta-propeller fold protein YncE